MYCHRFKYPTDDMCFTARNFAGCKFSMTAMGTITVVECFTIDMIGYNCRTYSIYLYYRYYQICEKALETDMVAPLQTHWIESMYQYIPRHLLTNFPSATEDFLQVT